MSNTSLWESVEKTDPKQTKPITGKSYNGTSPKPYYLVKRATEVFGPCGIGWGYEILEEKLLDGALLAPGFFERIHMARVRVWYEHDGKRGQVEHVGQTQFCGLRKSGQPFTDEDAPKKSVTDALVKALSMIGFAGDIFMGRYDDSKYVSELKREESERERASRSEKPLDESAVKIMLDLLRDCQSQEEISELLRKNKQAMDSLGPDAFQVLRERVKSRRAQLDQHKEAAE